MTRILGVLMARDEWPVLGVAVHHLLGQVDRVVVIDHCSTDATPAGLAALQRLVGERLQVIRIDAEDFWQEATTNLAISVASHADDDWVYVADADEFLLVDPTTTLAEVLGGVPSTSLAVRYELHNFLAPHDLDDEVTGLRGVRQRAVASEFLELPSDLLRDAIEHGAMNFLDLPFPSKIFVRPGVWVTAGTHDAVAGAPLDETALDPATVRAAHLPFLTRRRLDRKARQGRAVIEQGLPRYHGWQNQMLYGFETQGLLDDFWYAHSEGLATERFAPSVTVADGAFAASIEPSIRAMAELDVRAGERPVTMPRPDLPAALQAVRTAQQAFRDATAERARLAASAAWHEERADADARRLHQVITHRDMALAELDKRVAELLEAYDSNETLTAAVEHLERALADTRAEVEMNRQQSANLQAEIDAMRATRLWRLRDRLRGQRSAGK